MLVIGTVIIGAIVGLIIGVYEGIDWADQIVSGIVTSLFFGFIALLVAMMLQLSADTIFEQEYVKYSEEEIKAISNYHEYEGSFFLGSGSVNGKQEYYYMSESEKGINIRSIDASKSYVIEDNNVTPSIEFRESRFKSKLISKLFFDGIYQEYIIHVPESSIKYDFNIDF